MSSKYISDFRRGDTIAIEFIRSNTNSEGVQEPLPFIAGSSVKFSMKEDIDQIEPDLFVDHVAGSSSFDDINNGKILILLPASLTAKLEPAKYYWDLEVVEQTAFGLSTNTILPLPTEWKDRITVVADVTLNDD